MAQPPRPPEDLVRRTRKARKAWERRAGSYDESMTFFERRVLGREHREWVCGRARGATLEVAVGTGLNLRHYPPAVEVTGLDLSAAMLAAASRRAAALDHHVVLVQGDAHRLPFRNASFDSVVCTYSLCSIPHPPLALDEMKRVLRPTGCLLLVDHVRSSVRPFRWLQRLLELATVPLQGEHFTRRPLHDVTEAGFKVSERTRGRAGIIERVVAVKPGSDE